MMLLSWKEETWWKRVRSYPRLPFAPCRLAPRSRDRARPAQFRCQLSCRSDREPRSLTSLSVAGPTTCCPDLSPHPLLDGDARFRMRTELRNIELVLQPRSVNACSSSS